MPAGRSHYEVLGVPRDAVADVVRKAYLDRARELHPDRYVDAGDERRAAAQRSMQEVNEAWRVLGDPVRRRRYDTEVAPVTSARARWEHDDGRFSTRPDGTMRETIDVVDPTARVIRGLPWVILVVVLFAIFVFTAYAVTGNVSTTPQPGGVSSRCITVASGPTVQPASCDASGSRVVVSQVRVSEACPAGTERLQPATGEIAYCLEV